MKAVLSDECEPVSVSPTPAKFRQREGRATLQERRRSRTCSVCDFGDDAPLGTGCGRRQTSVTLASSRTAALAAQRFPHFRANRSAADPSERCGNKGSGRDVREVAHGDAYSEPAGQLFSHPGVT